MATRITRKLSVAIAAGAATLLIAGSAQSATTVTITSPALGTSISKSVTPEFEATGGVTFEAPSPATLTYYLVDEDSSEDDVCDISELRLEEGGAATSCGGGWEHGLPNEAAATVRGTPLRSRTYTASEGLPVTLRPGDATGVIRATTWTGLTNIGEGTLVVKLEGKMAGTTQWMTLGTASTTEQLDPTADANDFEFTMPIPSEVDGDNIDAQDFSGIRLHYHVRGKTVQHGYVEDNGASFIDLPVYSGSLDQSLWGVEVAVDSGEFSPADVSDDMTSWTALVPTPTSNGSHTLKVRAVQGGFRSATTTRRFSVKS